MEGHAMRNLIALVALTAFVIMPVANVFAVTSQDVTVNVSINHTLSINLPVTVLNIPETDLDDAKNSEVGLVIENDGTGPREKLELMVTESPSGWTLVQSDNPGVDEYALFAACATDISAFTWSTTNHALSTTAQACSDTKFYGDQNGGDIAKDGSVNLWMRFYAPEETEEAGGAINVNITASLK